MSCDVYANVNAGLVYIYICIYNHRFVFNMSGYDEYSSESKISKITINTVLCFIQENIGSCSKDILLEAVI